MRILFTSVPATGHFHPLVPLALAARDAGHEVAFATAEELRDQVTRLGLAFFAAGAPTKTFDLERRFPELAAMDRWEDRQIFIRPRLHAGLRIESQLPGVTQAAQAWRPEIIVRDCLELCGYLVAEQRGLPHVSVDVQPPGARMQRRDAMAPPLNRWRDALGLPPDPALVTLDRHLVVVPFPPSFRIPGDPVAATAHHVRPARFDTADREPPPPWILDGRAAGTPLVHLTTGTSFNTHPVAIRTMQAIVAGIADLPVQLIVTTGRDLDPSALGTLPRNTRAERYVSHGMLLPMCDLVISHAGGGVMAAAFGQGLPQLCVPLQDDQFENARAVVRLGAGAELDEAHRSPRDVADATRRLLADASYTEAARRVRDEIRRLPDVTTCVPLLERLASRRS